MKKLTITNVKTILTSPYGIPLVVVKVETSEPGLYGLGCATFTWRYLAVATAIDEYMKPFVLGKDPSRIEDLWQTANVNAYWRNGPVLNNALSGIDMALWDIKGKMANLPVYELLGGRCREGAAVYRHADGRDPKEVEDNVRKYMAQGIRHVRCQMGGYGGRDHTMNKPAGALEGVYYDPNLYALSVPRLFEHLRKELGFEVELCHDVHERLQPIEAVRLAKALEPFRLFFLEDAFAPEQIDWFETLRAQSATPIAMGELFNNPREWTPLIAGRLIDYIRVHISQIGGITPARKLAAFCDAFGVRTAWHGPGDVSPVGHNANVHLDISTTNFGIQEWCGFSDLTYEIFPGLCLLENGYLYPNDKPGLGIDCNEALAAKYPCENKLTGWTMTRSPDGTSMRP